MTEFVDIIVPRGGKSLIERVSARAGIPVITHLEGNCHVYIDRAADLDKALSIAMNAKMRRTGVCGATESLLVDRARRARHLPPMSAIAQAGCEMRGDDAVRAIDPRVQRGQRGGLVHRISGRRSSRCGWSTASTRRSRHIDRYGSHHTEAIVTEDAADGRAIPRRSRQRHRAAQRLDPIRRWRRIRHGRGNRHFHRVSCMRAGRSAWSS